MKSPDAAMNVNVAVATAPTTSMAASWRANMTEASAWSVPTDAFSADVRPNSDIVTMTRSFQRFRL